MTDLSGAYAGPAGERENPSVSGAADQSPMAMLRPLMEGARARGVADACEMLGVAAVLLDRAGEVLHVTSAASTVLGDGLRFAGGHLVAADPIANQAIERIVVAALSGESGQEVIPSEGAGDISLRALPLPGARQDEAQLLKAVLIVASQQRAARSATCD